MFIFEGENGRNFKPDEITVLSPAGIAWSTAAERQNEREIQRGSFGIHCHYLAINLNYVKQSFFKKISLLSYQCIGYRYFAKYETAKWYYAKWAAHWLPISQSRKSRILAEYPLQLVFLEVFL